MNGLIQNNDIPSTTTHTENLLSATLITRKYEQNNQLIDQLTDAAYYSFDSMDGVSLPLSLCHSDDVSNMPSIEMCTSTQSSNTDFETLKSATETISNSITLKRKIDELFRRKESSEIDLSQLNLDLIELMNTIDLSTSEINKYTFWDSNKPYTRNLMATDNKNYNLILLCWTPGLESKIHDHPCDTCFMKIIRGCIKESRYKIDQEHNRIVPTGVKFLSENQVAYIRDDMGLHKIGNPSQCGAVTLHLYTPPFKVCRVWPEHIVGSRTRTPSPRNFDSGVKSGTDKVLCTNRGRDQDVKLINSSSIIASINTSQLPITPIPKTSDGSTLPNNITSAPTIYYDRWQEGIVGFYSVYGHRTPHLEGSRTHFMQVMTELRVGTVASNDAIKGK